MKNNQNISVSKSYRALPFALLFGLMVGAASKGNAQSWSRADYERVEQYNLNESKNADRLYFNTIVAVSDNEIRVRDIATNKERIIKIVPMNYDKGNSPIIYLSTMSSGSAWGGTPIHQNYIHVVFQPGDTVLIGIEADRVSDNNPLKGEYNTTAEKYYKNSGEMLSSAVRILVPADALKLFLNRKNLTNKTEQRVR